MLLLVACHSDDTANFRHTAFDKSNAAYEFVMNVQELVSPIIETQGTLLEFAHDVEGDLNEINQSQLRAMGKAIDLLFEDLDDYIANALIEDNDGNFTSISWDLLPASTRTYDNGVSITRVGDAILVTGTDVSATYGNTVNSIDATLLISLPATTITDNTITLSASDLYITDDYLNRLETPLSYITISVSDRYGELVDVVNDETTQNNLTIQITDGTISLANAITLVGNGIVHVNNKPMATDGERTEQIDFDLTFTGTLGNAANHDLTAPLLAEFTYHEQTDWTDGTISDSVLSGLFAVDILLTEASPNATSIIAHLNYNVTAPEQGELVPINAEDIGFEFDSTVGMNIDSYRFHLHLAREESGFLFQLTDASQSTFAITLELYLNAKVDFERDNILIGQITVDGQPQATIILETQHNRVTAHFSNREVVLVNGDNANLFNNAD